MDDFEYTQLADSEPIPGYRLLQPLGHGGFGEVWKCEAPGGLLKAIKFVQGGFNLLDPNSSAKEELRAIQRVKSIRHPFILAMERFEVLKTGLVIVMELADKSLADVLEDQKAVGSPGIERQTLLRYLREAAEVLDMMNTRYHLQHLDIKPRNLFLVADHVKVGDFGLVSSAASKQGTLTLGAITPLYTSPEVLQGGISSQSDQYSLAIVYQELLTGILPFTGKNSRQVLMQHLSGEPNLTPLPPSDRAIIARALAKKPEVRYPSCTDLLESLLSGRGDVVTMPVRASRVNQTLVEDVGRTPFPAKLRGPAPRPIPANETQPVEMIELISRTPLTEVWSARGSDGTPRVVKVLFGCPPNMGQEVHRLGRLRHPTLMPIEVLSQAAGRVTVSTQPGDRSLRDALMQNQTTGRQGLPRQHLLSWLEPIAEALDSLGKQQGLYHLGLNPRTLVFEKDRLMMMDFGLAQIIWMPAGHSPAQLNGRYAPPEAGRMSLSHAADQYSLALIYCEMLTGTFPAQINLSRLPASDQPILARALHSDPRKRWGSNMEWIQALLEVSDAEEDFIPEAPPEPAIKAPPHMPIATPGKGLITRFGTSLSPEHVKQRLEIFRLQWSAREISNGPQQIVMFMQPPANVWGEEMADPPAVEIHFVTQSPALKDADGVQVRSELLMDLRPQGCSGQAGEEMLRLIGPLLVESVRAHLQVNSRGRKQERMTWQHPLLLRAIMPDGTTTTPIECQGKDISDNGIGFYLPGKLASRHLLLHLPQTPQTAKMNIEARVVRIQACGDGWYEVGAMLLPPDELPPDEFFD
jgi:serine/threonine protein kinase